MPISPEYLEVLNKNLNPIGNIDQEAMFELLKHLDQKDFKKGEKLIESGKYAKYLFFVCKGAIIGYITDREGKDYVKSVFFEGDFPSSQVSLLLETPSYMTLEAIEDCTVICINYKKFRELMEQFEAWKNFYISYLERSWIIAREKREVSLVMEPAQKRYLDFIQRYPDIENRLKQKYIAAHLGITATQLSRIRKKIND